MDEPVFILGSHKSGTSLLRSLLDGIDRYFVVPVETRFYQFAGYWISYSMRNSLPRKTSFEDFLNAVTQHIRLSDESKSRTSDSMLAGRWNELDFTEYFQTKGRPQHFESADSRGLFECYLQAIHVALFGREGQYASFVEKSVEHTEYAALIKKIILGSKFLGPIWQIVGFGASLRRPLRDRLGAL